MITLVMTTYFTEGVPERVDYALASLGSLLQFLYSKDGLKLHIADDSHESGETCEALAFMAESCGWPATSYSNSRHMGIGSSLNMAMRALQTDMFMYTTDDWLLTKQLELDGPAKLLGMGYDLVRLGPIHPDLACVSRFQAGLGWWLDLLPHYGGFAFATRPFLATKGFYDKIGPFNEGLNSYETERLYAERVAKSNAKLAYWGGVDLAGPWIHVGEKGVGCLNV